MIYSYNCHTQEETENLAKEFSKIGQIGDVWALFGTLGIGKSVWSRAFIKNLTSAQEVPSPTFTLVQVYQAQNFDIYHYDLYRLKSAEEIWELNIEEAMYANICLIEWPEKMGAYLPRNCFKVNIVANGVNGRRFDVEVNSTEKQERLLTCSIKPDNVYDDKR
ncbi:MAG: tRNA (adenosine(37)-N6)-threonylcarbamoyltransferase complex ATPase subunit type 1 TsaE [Alphaproteobacteria bacterium]|nr:tRNA (adenosine(37)-N6)-threonylcarbamoyltransferase complex ATPase subunit type 1 TsaE [Alphaproteobacteria bacterium]